MSISNSWQCLSVAKFWQSYNWDSQLPSQEILSATELKFKTLESWQELAVEDFWFLSNWDGKSGLSNGRQKSVIFSTELSVTDFWQCFTWQGKKISTTFINKNTFSVSPATSMPKKQTSLANLSQLF